MDRAKHIALVLCLALTMAGPRALAEAETEHLSTRNICGKLLLKLGLAVSAIGLIATLDGNVTPTSAGFPKTLLFESEEAAEERAAQKHQENMQVAWKLFAFGIPAMLGGAGLWYSDHRNNVRAKPTAPPKPTSSGLTVTGVPEGAKIYIDSELLEVVDRTARWIPFEEQQQAKHDLRIVFEGKIREHSLVTDWSHSLTVTFAELFR